MLIPVQRRSVRKYLLLVGPLCHFRSSQQSALVQKCAVEGKPYADTRSAREGIWHPSNSLTQPSGRHIGTPVETGPFEFVPDRFTRKQ
jgi:hypothetical protein